MIVFKKGHEFQEQPHFQEGSSLLRKVIFLMLMSKIEKEDAIFIRAWYFVQLHQSETPWMPGITASLELYHLTINVARYLRMIVFIRNILFSWKRSHYSRTLMDILCHHDSLEFSITHGTLRMGIRYFIVVIDDSIPWSSPSAHAPISVLLSFHRSEPISRHKRCPRRSLFWWLSRKPFCEIRGWHQSFNAFSFTRSISEIRPSLISAVCSQNADHFPRSYSAYSFLDIFSASDLFLG
jgi:hypothetical protein